MARRPCSSLNKHAAAEVSLCAELGRFDTPCYIAITTGLDCDPVDRELSVRRREFLQCQAFYS